LVAVAIGTTVPPRPLLRERLATQLGTGARLVTVDASELSFLDSASLRVLLLAARALQARHGTLVFAYPQPVVARLLEITGADRLLDVQESAVSQVTEET
jgi:anti-anti-sigma factor